MPNIDRDDEHATRYEMTDTKPTLGEQIDKYGLESMKPHILASLEELKRIREAEMPDEPTWISELRSDKFPASTDASLLQYIDALQAVIQRKEAELSDAVHLNDDQAQRVYNAERELASIRDALAGQDYASLPSDFPTVRMAHTIRADHDKFMQQVQDTCRRAESAERERDALIALVEKCNVALDKHKDGCKGWIGDAHVAAKEAIRNAAIDNAMDEGSGK
jgi:hypothetical protein